MAKTLQRLVEQHGFLEALNPPGKHLVWQFFLSCGFHFTSGASVGLERFVESQGVFVEPLDDLLVCRCDVRRFADVVGQVVKC